METAPYQNASKPGTGRGRNGAIMLNEPRESTGSSVAMTPDLAVLRDSDTQQLSLGLEIRRTRLVLFTLLMLAVIIGLTVSFQYGFSLAHFDSRDKNATERTKLLDHYNSYTGSVSSIFATPIELFVTVSVQLIVLRFMAALFIRPEMSWRLTVMTLLFGAAIAYLISNSFNALNVQLRPQEVHSVISDVDLGRDNAVVYPNKSFVETSATSFAELRPQNPATNTILHSLLVPMNQIVTQSCPYTSTRDGVNTLSNSIDQVDRPYLNLGLPQHEWQGRILQEALPSKSFRLIVNPTNASINDAVNTSALPMDATQAAVLFNSAMITGTYFFPWGARRDYVNQTDLLKRYPFNDSLEHNISESFTIVNGLLPAGEKDEAAQRAFLIPAMLAAASRQFANSSRTKTSDIVMEFSHTQISPTITFDAVTFEFELDPLLLATTVSDDNATRYTVLNQRFECPLAQHCFVPKPTYTAVRPQYDTPAQVVAFRLCTTKNGSEVVDANVTIQNNTIVKHVTSCARVKDPTQAIRIMSIGKRLVADALEQNVSIAANGTTRSTDAATVTNMRKIYTFTVGRLAWDYTDLGNAFNANCEAEGANCRGLELPLSKPLSSSTTVNNGAAQRLVVGKEAIRLGQLVLNRDASRVSYDKTNLIAVAEPPELSNSSSFYRAMAGDLLLPHNIRNITWNLESMHPQCDFEAEVRAIILRSQHMYMEHSLQGAYTAGTYYLFQSAVVRDTIALSSSRKSLAFQHNSQQIKVWVSTPLQNMWLTLAGCFVLVVGLCSVVVKTVWFSQNDQDALAHITEPNTIARVMMDERRYPPLFLHRRVVEKDHVASVDDFAIAALSLQQQQQQREHDAKNARGNSEAFV